MADEGFERPTCRHPNHAPAFAESRCVRLTRTQLALVFHHRHEVARCVPIRRVFECVEVRGRSQQEEQRPYAKCRLRSAGQDGGKRGRLFGEQGCTANKPRLFPTWRRAKSAAPTTIGWSDRIAGYSWLSDDRRQASSSSGRPGCLTRLIQVAARGERARSTRVGTGATWVCGFGERAGATPSISREQSRPINEPDCSGSRAFSERQFVPWFAQLGNSGFDESWSLLAALLQSMNVAVMFGLT